MKIASILFSFLFCGIAIAMPGVDSSGGTGALKEVWSCTSASGQTQIEILAAPSGILVVSVADASDSHQGGSFNVSLVPRRPGSEGPMEYSGTNFDLQINTGVTPSTDGYSATLNAAAIDETDFTCLKK